MAATPWYYTTEFTENPDDALHLLQDQVFRSGNYGSRYWSNLRTNFWRMPLMTQLIVGVLSLIVAVQQIASWISRGGRGPRSIDEAVAISGESGTHSILDIDRCSQTPNLGNAFPLSFALRNEIFGTDKPTLADWERAGHLAPVAKLQRWTAVYFTIYEEGEPSMIAFVGCSGD